MAIPRLNTSLTTAVRQNLGLRCKNLYTTKSHDDTKHLEGLQRTMKCACRGYPNQRAHGTTRCVRVSLPVSAPNPVAFEYQ